MHLVGPRPDIADNIRYYTQEELEISSSQARCYGVCTPDTSSAPWRRPSTPGSCCAGCARSPAAWSGTPSNALALARALEAHPAVEAVHYPGLESHPGHAIAKRQMSAFGGMLSLRVRGGRDAAVRAASRVKALRQRDEPRRHGEPARAPRLERGAGLADAAEPAPGLRRPRAPGRPDRGPPAGARLSAGPPAGPRFRRGFFLVEPGSRERGDDVVDERPDERHGMNGKRPRFVIAMVISTQERNQTATPARTAVAAPAP